jgi:hypothetical protein
MVFGHPSEASFRRYRGKGMGNGNLVPFLPSLGLAVHQREPGRVHVRGVMLDVQMVERRGGPRMALGRLMGVERQLRFNKTLW